MKMYCQSCDWSYEPNPTASSVQNCPECYGSWFSSQPRVQCPQCGTKFALPIPQIQTYAAEQPVSKDK